MQGSIVVQELLGLGSSRRKELGRMRVGGPTSHFCRSIRPFNPKYLLYGLGHNLISVYRIKAPESQIILSHVGHMIIP